MADDTWIVGSYLVLEAPEYIYRVLSVSDKCVTLMRVISRRTASKLASGELTLGKIAILCTACDGDLHTYMRLVERRRRESDIAGWGEYLNGPLQYSTMKASEQRVFNGEFDAVQTLSDEMGICVPVKLHISYEGDPFVYDYVSAKPVLVLGGGVSWKDDRKATTQQEDSL